MKHWIGTILQRPFIPTILLILITLPCAWAESNTFYVATDGSNSGDGSAAAPWSSIEHALDNVPDGSLILVREGTYNGSISLEGDFTNGVTVRSEIPYQARLRNDGKVISAKGNSNGCRGITLEGFDIAHDGPGAGALVIHIDGGGDGDVSHITLRNNVLHDSYDNDVLKINHSAHHIVVTGNLFYNQHGEDEHIDINSVHNIIVEDNVFFNDFAGSGRPENNDNSTSSFIVIKDSNGDNDIVLGSHDISIRRNIFFNWEGCPEHSFIMVGEDGHAHFEAYDVLIENNLMLGNKDNLMRAALSIRGVRDVTFRNNTISGDLPSQAYAMRLNIRDDNQLNENIRFYNNIWSDPNGSMGAAAGSGNDFSDCDPAETTSFVLENNLYWNGAQSMPIDNNELINYTDDSQRSEGDPLLGDQSGLVLPRWNENSGLFGDGSATIRAAFLRLVNLYGTPASGSAAIDIGTSAQSPADDILGRSRNTGGVPDVGAFEVGAIANIGDEIPGKLPERLFLAQNYPNPFNPSTTIRFRLPAAGEVRLVVFNLLGEKVATLLEEYRNAGEYELQWEASGFPSGVYFYRLESRSGNEIRKMFLMK